MAIKLELQSWISERQAFQELCRSNIHVHAVLMVSSHEHWGVERFLEECVTVLAAVNGNLAKELLDRALLDIPSPITVGGVEYSYVGPTK